MENILRIIIFICFSSLSYIVTLANYFFYEGNLIVRQVYLSEDYQFWLRVKFDDIACANLANKLESSIDKVGRIAEGKVVSVIYLYQYDIVSCKDYIEDIAKIVHSRNFLLALNFDTSIKKEELLHNSMNFDLENFKKKYVIENFKDLDLWVSYIVFDNVMNLLTFEERKQVLAFLRTIFPRSNIGFAFSNDIRPTPDNKHPTRDNVDWDKFLPMEDDGDFVITPYALSNFKRTLLISDGAWTIGSHGHVLNFSL